MQPQQQRRGTPTSTPSISGSFESSAVSSRSSDGGDVAGLRKRGADGRARDTVGQARASPGTGDVLPRQSGSPVMSGSGSSVGSSGGSRSSGSARGSSGSASSSSSAGPVSSAGLMSIVLVRSSGSGARLLRRPCVWERRLLSTPVLCFCVPFDTCFLCT
eukprot:366096-Pelagomonas_calceolata.AAC.3